MPHMTKRYFYHYTDDEGAKNIIRSGKIMASLSYMASDDAGFGNGVYLTMLKPETNTQTKISRNNWAQTSDKFIKKTENYFVLDIPESGVKDASDASGRDIFLFGRGKDLRLSKYKWWLKNYESGQILASYKYKLDTIGPASLLPKLVNVMGDYIMSEETVNGRIVYKHVALPERYLFMSSCGKWLVGQDAEKYNGWLMQKSKYSLGPHSTLPWEYADYDNHWITDDSTLKASPYQV